MDTCASLGGSNGTAEKGRQQRIPISWFFWHPIARCAVSLLAVGLAMFLYAEDPVGHSDESAFLKVAGPVLNLVFCAMTFDVLCLFGLLGSVTGGVLLAYCVLHPWLRDRCRFGVFGFVSVQQMAQLAKSESASMRLAAQRTKGRFTITCCVVSILLVAVSHILPSVAFALNLSRCVSLHHQRDAKNGFHTVESPFEASACRLSSTLPLSNASYTRLMAVLTFALDLIAFMMLMEAMLQEASRPSTAGAAAGVSRTAAEPYLTRAPHYKSELILLRRVDAKVRNKRFPLPPIAIVVVLWFLIGVYLMHALPLRWIGTCSEIGRVFLASSRLCADVVVVLQDWEFPHFRQVRRISLAGWFDSHVTGKWLNYGVLGCTVVLDINTVRYHLCYHPRKFGQTVQGRTHMILSVAHDPHHGPDHHAYHHRHFHLAYSYFENYSMSAKLLFTFPVWIAAALLFMGLRRWRIRTPAAATTPELVFVPSPTSPPTITQTFPTVSAIL